MDQVIILTIKKNGESIEYQERLYDSVMELIQNNFEECSVSITSTLLESTGTNLEDLEKYP
jgi:hypothetical protein